MKQMPTKFIECYLIGRKREGKTINKNAKESLLKKGFPWHLLNEKDDEELGIG